MAFSEKNILFLTSMLVFILGLLCIDEGHNWADDFAMYVSQCQALQEGSMQELFERNRYAMDNSYAHTGPYLYPNGFPLLLLPVYSFFGVETQCIASLLWAMKVYCWLFFVAALPFIYLIFKQLGCSSRHSSAIVLLVGFNYHFIRFSDNVLSDLPFFFFSLWSFYCIQKHRTSSLLKAIGLGGLLFFTYSIRDVGILLLPCLCLFQWQLFRSNKAFSIPTALIPYLVFIMLWLLLHFWTANAGEKHLEMLASSSFETIGNNMYYYWLLMGNYFVIFRGMPSLLQYFFAAVFSFIIIIGMAKNRWAHSYLLAYVGLTFGLYFLWVSFQGMRFIFPLMPFLLFYLLEGLQVIFKQKKQFRFVLLGLIVSSILQSGLTTYYYWQKDSNEAYSSDLQAIYNYIKRELPPNAIIVFEKPRALRLFSHRNSVQKEIEAAQYALIRTNKKLDKALFETNTYTLIER